MKKISLALSFLLFSNINLYAVSFTDNDINNILEEFDCIEDTITVKLHGASPVVSVCYKQACPLFEKQKHLKSS
jgi:hypothetical protein